MRDRPPGERGAALLTVLLLVAIVGALAAATLEKLNLATRQGSNANAMMQARAWADAAATMALVRIDNVLGQDRSQVSLAGGWSDRPFPLPVPQGVATARVRDGGNCFNLNGLVSADGRGGRATRPAAVAHFSRLLNLLGVRGGGGIAAAAADWIDSDSATNPGGAEDDAYAGRSPPYLAANAMMADPTELRAVAGVTAEAFAKFRPYLCTLPTTDTATINVNTLEPERAALIAALVPGGVSTEQVRAALLARPALGWASTSEFWSRIPPAVGGGVALGETAVTTRWFIVRSDVAIGRIALRQTTLVDARRVPTRIVARSWGEDE